MEAETQIETTEATAAPETTNDDWRSGISEDIRDNPTLAKYDSIDKLAAAHINLQSHLGRNKITKPVTEDDWNNVYDFLGRPEDASKYETNVPEDVQQLLSEESLTGLKEVAHKSGMTQAQLSSLMDWWAGDIGAQMKVQQDAQAQAFEEGEAALKEEWGRAFEKNVEIVQKVFKEYASDEVAQKIETAGLANDPDVLKFFHKVATSTMPEADLKGPTNQKGEALTPQEAKDRASEIMAHPAYTDKRHPEHAKLVRQVKVLFEQAYG